MDDSELLDELNSELKRRCHVNLTYQFEGWNLLKEQTTELQECGLQVLFGSDDVLAETTASH
jgi:hypothetical protein